MNIMARNKKNVLNQSVKEPVIKEELEVVEELTQEDMDMDKYDMTVHSEVHPPVKEQKSAQEEISLKDSMEKVVEEISLKVSGEKLAEVIKEKEEKAIINKEEIKDTKVEEIVAPRSVRDLSKDMVGKMSQKELRMFRRTGMLPQ